MSKTVPEGYCFRAKKKGLKKGTILVPIRALYLLNNHVYATVPLVHWSTKIVPLKIPYYGQLNSAPRGTVSVPFFLSDDMYVHSEKNK